MDDKINIPYKKYTKRTSPIISYYSHLTNPNNENYNSEISKIQEMNLQNTEQNKISDNNNNNKKNLFNESNKIRKYSSQKNNNFKLKSEMDITKKYSYDKTYEKKDIIEDNKNINKEINCINEIKVIKPEDLIPTKVNNSVILRINPLIYQNESYDFLSSNLYILLKDQLGCKFLQEKLQKDPKNSVYFFFKSLVPNIVELIKDKFANYFIQRFFYYLSEEQLEYILKIISNDFFEICNDNHGTRVIQCLIDYLITENLRNIFFENIRPIFIQLINEINGTHIIYKFLYNFPEFSEISNDIITDNIIQIATHKRGCIFLQNYISGIKQYNFWQKVIQNLLKNIHVLIIDQYGNYLMQYLLNLKDSQITLEIINKTINNIAFYSKHKYANYVIEKILINSDYSQKQKIVEKISSQDIMNELIFDQQGNFIILKALKFADENKRKNILDIINNLKKKIEEFPNGKTFLKKLQNYYEYK